MAEADAGDRGSDNDSVIPPKKRTLRASSRALAEEEKIGEGSPRSLRRLRGTTAASEVSPSGSDITQTRSEGKRGREDKEVNRIGKQGKK